jgi:copper chaperone CopZ
MAAREVVMLVKSSLLMVLGATLAGVTLQVEGMTCGGCTLATRKLLTRLEGVEKAVVTYEPPRAVVTFHPRKVTVPQIIAAIKTLGYRATVAS